MLEGVILFFMLSVGLSIHLYCNIMFLKYLEELSIEFHQTMQTFIFTWQILIIRKIRARGQFYECYFPLQFLMAFVYA